METPKSQETSWAIALLAIPCILAPLVNLALLDHRSWPYWLWLLGGVIVLVAASSLEDHYKK